MGARAHDFKLCGPAGLGASPAQEDEEVVRRPHLLDNSGKPSNA